MGEIYNCGYCNKEMPAIWEVKCKGCEKDFCYEHSINVAGFWYCWHCVKPSIKTSLTIFKRMVKTEYMKRSEFNKGLIWFVIGWIASISFHTIVRNIMEVVK